MNISAQVEELASRYGFVKQPMSAGTPQENGFAEKAVGDATRQARAFMLGASHIHKNKWGVAYRYASFVNLYLEKTGKGGCDSIPKHSPQNPKHETLRFACLRLPSTDGTFRQSSKQDE